jgi:hypothetical protein
MWWGGAGAVVGWWGGGVVGWWGDGLWAVFVYVARCWVVSLRMRAKTGKTFEEWQKKDETIRSMLRGARHRVREWFGAALVCCCTRVLCKSL